jgi:hypothetical protein
MAEVLCSICRQEITPTDSQRFMACTHRFHSYCLDEWQTCKGCAFEDLPCPDCKMTENGLRLNAEQLQNSAALPPVSLTAQHSDVIFSRACNAVKEF